MSGFGLHRWSVVAAGAVFALTVGTGSAAPTAPAAGGGRAVAPPGRAVVADYVPLWSVPTTEDGTAAADLGAAAPREPVAARVYLTGRSPAGLAAYAKAASTPGDPLYRRYLTPRQEQTMFGPTRARTDAVRSWLSAAGLRVTAVPAHYVEVTGTAAQADLAFGVRTSPPTPAWAAAYESA